jgi:hypothetical protein
MSQELQTNALHELGRACLAMPQINMDLFHLFSDQAYARMIIMPADSVVMSAIHKSRHMTVCCYGIVDVVDDHGNKQRIYGPHFWNTEPGTQRALHIIEESCWVTFHIGKFESVEDAENHLIDLPSFVGEKNEIV